MHSEMETIRCSIVRGGTSKGIFIMDNELPKEQELRDKVILSIFGSPDVRQIDGLGGADVLTSKLAIVGPSTRPDCDVDYTFGQVSFEKPFIDYGGNCGNISSAVGPYAIDMGLVKAIEPITTVKIHLTNSDSVITAEVPVKDGKARVEGDFKIDGVPGTGAKITIDWSEVIGTVKGKLLPTDNVKDKIIVDGKTYIVSIVDVGNPLVFIEAKELGMKGIETVVEIESNKELMDEIERIRGEVCRLIGLVDKAEDAKIETPYSPFFAIVSKPQDYIAINGEEIKKENIDIVSRLLFMLKMHKAYPITGTVCTGAACRIPGTIPNDILNKASRNKDTIRIGHPSGALDVEAIAEVKEKSVKFKKIGVYRTARTIMNGDVFVKKSVLK
ncbi:MAG TPA: 3-methylitaconate isomerase [Gallicola sp.]|nr:3-methylitaconate isomerase [Gallicola sp.]